MGVLLGSSVVVCFSFQQLPFQLFWDVYLPGNIKRVGLCWVWCTRERQGGVQILVGVVQKGVRQVWSQDASFADELLESLDGLVLFAWVLLEDVVVAVDDLELHLVTELLFELAAQGRIGEWVTIAMNDE